MTTNGWLKNTPGEGTGPTEHVGSLGIPVGRVPSRGALEVFQQAAQALYARPLWQAADLGRPIPDSPHAVSVALPRWQDVVDYEEHHPEIIAKLASGYPRFVIHPQVRIVAQRLAGNAPCLPFPSAESARLAAGFVRTASHETAEVSAQDGMYGVITTAAGNNSLRAFWQHTGLIVSSRRAEAWLAGGMIDADGLESRRSLRRQLAELYECDIDDVFLSPTGMAAHFAALRALNHWRPKLATAQLGFPYVDTLKLQQKIGHGGILLHDLPHIEKDLRLLLAQRSLAACFCEIPGNPLLGCVNVRDIHPILREHGVPLVVDDVVATPINVDLSPYADLIATSLTKYIAGTGDAMGGALICNPRSAFYHELKPRVRAQHEELLWGSDAVILDAQARGFPDRMRRHNSNGLCLAERLRRHPAIEKVWYPKWEFSEAYEAVRRSQGGWSSLITFLSKRAEETAPRIYDALAVSKGPSLGTVFTLACPFTLLAHYSELPWAESCGLSRHLIRISIGLEDPDELWQKLETALKTTQ